MEEHANWKGQGFTMLVFAGIVFLCSIFFVLGMLVGRSQGQKFAAVAAAEAAAKAAQPIAASEERPEMTFYESVENTHPAPVLEPAPAQLARPAAPTSIADAGPVINFQIAALRKSADAEKLLDEAKGKGFRGFILAPTPGDTKPLYRVQIGPYSDPVEAEMAKQKLAASGYQPIKK